MICGGLSSYELVNIPCISRLLRWMRSKFIDSNQLCLKWEKAIFVYSFHDAWNIYPLQSHFEPHRIFLSKIKSGHGSQPTLEANKGFFCWKDEDNVRINGKRNVKNKSLTIEKGLKKKYIH